MILSCHGEPVGVSPEEAAVARKIKAPHFSSFALYPLPYTLNLTPYTFPMCKQEHKICPRCSSTFECKAGDIGKCQCFTVKLNDAERDFLARSYSDCLCAACMQALRTSYQQAQQEIALKRLFGSR